MKTCPKCGAKQKGRNDAVIFECDSLYLPKTAKFSQSERCIISCCKDLVRELRNSEITVYDFLLVIKKKCGM